jgi:hypothetical protein
LTLRAAGDRCPAPRAGRTDYPDIGPAPTEPDKAFYRASSPIVAPREGAWIETQSGRGLMRKKIGRGALVITPRPEQRESIHIGDCAAPSRPQPLSAAALARAIAATSPGSPAGRAAGIASDAGSASPDGMERLRP